MQDDDQQSSDIKDYVTPAKPHGEKVIQPSASLIEELKQEQATAKAAPTTPAPQGVAQTPPSSVTAAPTPETPPRPPSPSSVYPDVTKGIGADAPIPSSALPDNPQFTQPSASSLKIIRAIKIVAGILVAANLYYAYNWFVGPHVGIYSLINLVGIMLGMLLALGIFTLREMARSIYVIITAISLVLTCIGLVALLATSSFLISTHTASKAQLESSLAATEHNTSLSPQVKQADIQRLQAEINSAPPSNSPPNYKLYLSYALLIVTGVFPLVFFIRPAIKAEFN